MTELLRSPAHDSQGTDPAVKEGRDCRLGPLCESCARLGCVILTRQRLLAFVGPHFATLPFQQILQSRKPAHFALLAQRENCACLRC
jgi:hypothetical protein